MLVIVHSLISTTTRLIIVKQNIKGLAGNEVQGTRRCAAFQCKWILIY